MAGARGEIVDAKYLFRAKNCIFDSCLRIYFWHRSFLTSALSLSTLAGKGHLRALLLAQVGARYLYTAPAHAMETLVGGLSSNVVPEEPDPCSQVESAGRNQEFQTDSVTMIFLYHLASSIKLMIHPSC